MSFNYHLFHFYRTWRRLTQPVRDSCLSEEDTSLLRLVADTTQVIDFSIRNTLTS